MTQPLFNLDQIAPARIVTPNPKLLAIHKACGGPSLDERVLGIDPGETTGTATWNPDTQKIVLRQWPTKNIGLSFQHFRQLIRTFKPTHVRFENYKVYGWKADDHAWADLHTAKWIGAIMALCYDEGIPSSSMMAQQAKKFWTDEKLKMVGAYESGYKHARDAERHLLYYLCFGTKSVDQ